MRRYVWVSAFAAIFCLIIGIIVLPFDIMFIALFLRRKSFGKQILFKGLSGIP